MRRLIAALGWPAAAAMLCSASAWAQVAPTGAEPAARQSPVPAETPAASETAGPSGIFERDKLLGTLGGIRTKLDEYGVTLGLTEASEVLGNVSGGRRTGAVYEGLTTVSLDIDMERAVGLSGGTFHASAFQIHGRGLSANNLGNLNTASSIEATRATRLFELWYQQAFLDGKVDIKIGQQSADLEFMTSKYAGLFVNASFGWPTLFATNLPSGGNAYPLGALGARLRVKPADPMTVLLAAFNGNPARPGDGDPQLRNASGTSFRLNDGVFVIGEVQYVVDGGENPPGLPGTYKLGAWYNSSTFADQSATPVDPSTPGYVGPRSLRGNWSVYAVADQLVWQPKGGGKDTGVGVFARAAGSPGDRSLVNVFVDGGVTYKGVFGLDDDTVGLGLGWARISDTARAADTLTATLPGASYLPVRGSEWILEASYQAQLLPSIQLQPFFQYVVSPGGGIVNPDRPGKRQGDAAVLGMRSLITF